MKSSLWIICSLLIANLAGGQNFHMLPRYDEALARFDFSDQYGGCDEAIEGRWFLHFMPSGEIRIGLWSDDPSRKLKYRFDDELSPDIEVNDIFSNEPKWRRINTHTFEIKNRLKSFQFTITPNFATNTPTDSTSFLRFYEVGGKGRVFMIGFLPQYKAQFESSKEFR